MTLIFVIVAGFGAILVVAALENKTNIGQTFQDIINGNVRVAKQQPSNGTSNLGPEAGGVPGGGSLATSPNVGTKWVTDFPQTFGFGQMFGQFPNTGVDFGTPYQTPIGSLVSGTVVSAQDVPNEGGAVLVQFQEGAQTLYAAYIHMSSFAVSVGQHVNVGQEIGLSGGQIGYGNMPASSLLSSGPHTLFGLFTAPITDFAHAVNPSVFLKQFEGVTT